ncbi:MAG: ATP-binding protein [Pseudomonadota bacterium]
MQRMWSGLTLRGQLTILLATTVLLFEIITTSVEYHVLRARAIERERTTATDFARTAYTFFSIIPAHVRDELAAGVEGPRHAVRFESLIAEQATYLPKQAARLLSTLQDLGYDVDKVIISERWTAHPDPSRFELRRGNLVEIDVAMRDASRGEWLVATTRDISMPAVIPLLITVSLESFAAIVVLLAVLAVIGRLLGPMDRLSESANRIAHGEIVSPLRLQGSADMRDTIKTFNQMSESVAQTISYQQSLIQSLGHDLKAPLATARMLVDDATVPPARDQIDASLERVQAILASITDFTRATLRDGDVERVDLASLLEALVEEAEGRNHEVTSELADDVIVPARYHAIERALRNLIENACIHGGRARVTLVREDDNALIWIDDWGDGIDEDMLEQVFEPFSRLSTDPRGSGLGLAIARTIIVDHGGNLKLENRAEGGLRQSVTLPI